MLRTTFYMELQINCAISTEFAITKVCTALNNSGVGHYAKVGVFSRKVENAADARILDIASHSRTKPEYAHKVFSAVGNMLHSEYALFDMPSNGLLFPAVTHVLSPRTAIDVSAEMIRIMCGGYAVIGKFEQGRARLDWGQVCYNKNNNSYFLLGDWR